MTDAFQRAFALILQLEGGYVNDPRDPGGETRFGISKAAHPQIDIANLTEEMAAQIYRDSYWRRVRCDDLPWIFALPLFDGAVNQGAGAVVKLFQSALPVIPDGVIGPKTIAAAQAVPEADRLDVLADFMARRAMRYANLPTFTAYGRGWCRRLFVVHRHAIKEEKD